MARTTYKPAPPPPGGWPDWMDAETAADYIGVGVEEVRVRCREGKIRHSRSGSPTRGPLRIQRLALDEHLRSNEQGGPNLSAQTRTPAA